jgi:hypothetical protein
MTHNSNVPTGEDYLVKIVSITKKAVTRGMATILTYEVMEGPFRGEQIVDYLSFRHESEYARKIACEKLANIRKVICGCDVSLETLIGKTMVIHMDMEQGLNTVSRSGYRDARSWFVPLKSTPKHTQMEELVIELTPHEPCEYMIIRRHGNARRVNFSPDDTEENRKMKIAGAIQELDFAQKGGK